jgi:hypothetical protein
MGRLVTKADDGLIINRSLFHENMAKELELYINLLRTPDTSECERKLFRKKMDFVCRE